MSTTNKIDCSNILIQEDQSRRLALFNIPQTRYTPTSPYPAHTKQQLDMRRKAEILKYKSNMVSKTNNLTKKQTYASLAQSGSNPYNNFLAQLTSSCPANDTKPTISTASDVPGPPMMLYMDPSVPVYNLTNASIDGASYSNLGPSDTSVMKMYTVQEVVYKETLEAHLVNDAINYYK